MQFDNEWDVFKHEYRDTAIEKLFDEDARFLVEMIVDYGADTDVNGEYAQDIMSLALRYTLFSDDRTIGFDEADASHTQMMVMIQEAPFFEELVEHKLKEMWENGYTMDEHDYHARYGE